MTDETQTDAAETPAPRVIERKVVWVGKGEPPHEIGRTGPPIRPPKDQRKPFSLPKDQAAVLVNSIDGYKYFQEDKGKKA